MSELLALSFDCIASPILHIRRQKSQQSEKNQYYGWGVAWYPGDEGGAALMKDSTTQAGKMLTKTIRSWKEFSSTQFLCYIRGAAKGILQNNTQPFRRSYAGRDWILSHLGDLYQSNYKMELALGAHPAFEPMGNTDSEFLFCWILRQIHLARCRSLSEFQFDTLYTLLQKANTLGSTSIILGDGETLIAYNDVHNTAPLYQLRVRPPYASKSLSYGDTRLEVGEKLEAYRTFMVVSNNQDKKMQGQTMNPGQMIAIRRGTIIWDSCQLKEKKGKKQATLNMPVASKKSSRLQVVHETTYQYDHPVLSSKHYLRLHPIQDTYQKMITSALKISVPHDKHVFEDVFGNKTTFAQLDKAYNKLKIRLATCVETKDIPVSRPIGQRLSIPMVWMPWQHQMMSAYLLAPELPQSQLVELFEYAMSFVARNEGDVIDILHDINETIYRDFQYVSGASTVYTTPYQTYTARKGVCQDFTNLMICLCRLLNIPARYRMGYLYTGGRYANKIQSDASHAWVEVYLPWQGWIGFDPTNGVLSNKTHIRIACGRNYMDATPTSGTIYKGGGIETLSIFVRVTEVDSEANPNATAS